ncbi:MAG: 50S ribosomal protein L25 [Candidatus Shapirobacteria bacterium]|nr:50S ribosomal protein L25 [Candidatus Shapirobacteria bacterium]
MARLKLTANKRTITGRKVKTLRQEGILPANLYGQGIKSQSLQVSYQDFVKVFKKTGESGLIDLVIGGTKSARPVLVGDIQTDPVTDKILHVDFRQVDLTQKTIVTVSIELVGGAPAVESGVGILIQPLLEVEVEALPEDLPDHIDADVSSLKEINDAVRVADLKISSKVTIKADQDEMVAKIEAPAEEEEEVTPAEEPEVIGKEGKEDQEGEGKSEEGKTEEKPEEAKPKEKPQETVKKENSPKKE